MIAVRLKSAKSLHRYPSAQITGLTQGDAMWGLRGCSEVQTCPAKHRPIAFVLAVRGDRSASEANAALVAVDTGSSHTARGDISGLGKVLVRAPRGSAALISTIAPNAPVTSRARSHLHERLPTTCCLAHRRRESPGPARASLFSSRAWLSSRSEVLSPPASR